MPMKKKIVVVTGDPPVRSMPQIIKQAFKCKDCNFRNVCSVLYTDESVGCEKYKYNK